MLGERINWIDVARGIGILLVIYGHGLGATPIRYFIYSFHMPLFFFLSGIVMHKRINEPYSASLKKDIKRILIPYFFFAILFYFNWLLNVKNPTSEVLIHQLVGIFYGSGNNRFLIFDIVLWFLPCLFVVKQVFFFISKLSVKQILICLLCFSVLGYLYSISINNIKLPFNAETGLTAITFFGLGFLWNKLPQDKLFFLKKYSLLFFIAFGIFTILFAYLNFQINGTQIDLRLNRLNNYFLFYFAALSGILATVFISISIKSNKIIEYLGKNSLILFAAHLVVFYYISKILMYFISADKIIELRNIYLAPIYTVISIIFIILCTEAYKRFKNSTTIELKKILPSSW